MYKKIFIFMLFCNFFASAQNKISGIVYDDTQTPLQGASVYFKNTQKGTTTSEKGTFELEFIPNSKLIISYVGFKTDTLVVNSQS